MNVDERRKQQRAAIIKAFPELTGSNGKQWINNLLATINYKQKNHGLIATHLWNILHKAGKK
jgi:hypothetical protein